MKKFCLSAIGGFCFWLLFFQWTTTTSAAITNAKDVLTTTRPSALTSLTVGASAGSATLTISAGTGSNDNRSRFIASDSAMLVDGGIEFVTVASMSAVLNTGSTAVLYLATSPTSNHNIGTSVMMAATAKHTIQFTATTLIPNNGDIQIIFSVGNTTNQNYPSANGFSFNGLAIADLSASFSPAGPTVSGWTITPGSGLVQCNLGTGITGPTTVTINIGTSTTNPVLINPAKRNTVAWGTEDNWNIRIKTRDSSDNDIDTERVGLAMIEPVEIYAVVEPYINLVISGIANGAAVNIGNTSCGTTQPTNSGINSTATVVDLGVLDSNNTNLSAQHLAVSTNGMGGYSLTATASGHLIDHSLGYWIADAQGTIQGNDNPNPQVITTGTSGFGLRPCGTDTTDATWSNTGNDLCTAGVNCKYANPSAKYYYTMASDITGPVGSGSGDGDDDGETSVSYAATISSIVPAGTYKTAITYIATATF